MLRGGKRGRWLDSAVAEVICSSENIERFIDSFLSR
jgi:hypothetical protein